MAISLTPTPRQRFVDQNGDPLAAGKVYTYAAGTLNPAITYANKDGTENSNPIILDAAGKADIWILDNISYKYVVKDLNDADIETIDDISIPEVTGGGGGGGGTPLRSGVQAISNGSSVVDITFSSAVDDTTYRIPAPSFINTVDTDPINFSYTITEKTVDGFKIKLGAPADSANYKVEYSVHENT